MTTPAKLGLGVLSLGSATGIAYAGSTYFSDSKETTPTSKKTSISTLIEKEFKHVLLKTTAGKDNTDQTHWGTIWTKYKNENNSNNDVFRLQGWATRGEKDLTDLLKAKCQELSDSQILGRSEDVYTNVTKYCAREATLADEVAKYQLKEIDTAGATEDSKLWATRKTQKATLQTKLDTLNIKGEDLDPSKFKTACKAAKDKKRNEQNYSVFYEAYKAVCTKQVDEA